MNNRIADELLAANAEHGVVVGTFMYDVLSVIHALRTFILFMSYRNKDNEIGRNYEIFSRRRLDDCLLRFIITFYARLSCQ